MKYYFRQINEYKNPVPLYFLCGVQYNKKNPQDDKRVVLKEYLKEKKCCSIILEQYFNPKKSSGKLGYDTIGLQNLNDVETLACMAVDGVFIIHESHSTAAEIALFASTEAVAEKTFVLVPDKENAETNHFSGFLELGYKSLMPRHITFTPVIEKHIVNESKVEIKTFFKNNKIGKNLEKKIDDCINNAYRFKVLNIKKSNYHLNYNESISYYIDSNNLINMSIDVQLLKYYMIAIFSISEFRKEIRKTLRYFDGLTVCEVWFKKILLNSIQRNEASSIGKLNCKFEISNSINGRLDFRKAISFILYIFHGLGWIEIDINDKKGITMSKKTDDSTGFKYIYEKYSNIICEDTYLDIEGI
ncbi:hypothetical protein psyc5s11_45310 [Clostridium gelidum]|uniref:Nucleoside 2-deoxyribosyltransferase n=1 Tax=Clostridium gelidum TaxID=704125 RepID=A0ABN6J6W3_9CLOT|nr:hypothetical protein [Clostridium gelidum]BCZ48464.1 hypothetical protein psyc5s11_45310 [Clostridium gelidum]